MKWYEYPIGVPFGNPGYDVGLGGSHDMTFLCPPNTEIFQVVPGRITDISEPSWGKQVTVEMDQAIDNHPYFAILHLAAVEESLYIGKEMQPNDLVGWSGGCVNSAQYNGTHNPTGQNFCNSSNMSSQPQVGIALCDGPGYGYRGWKTFPPIDTTLDPMPVLERYKKEFLPSQPVVPDYVRTQFETMWTSIVPKLDPTTGIANHMWASFRSGINHGPPLTKEMRSVDNKGNVLLWQIFPTGICTWFNHEAGWVPFK